MSKYQLQKEVLESNEMSFLAMCTTFTIGGCTYYHIHYWEIFDGWQGNKIVSVVHFYLDASS